MNKFLFYPTLNRIHLDNINLVKEDNFRFYFNDNDKGIQRQVIVKNTKDSKLLISDRNNIWYIDQHNLIIKKTLSLNPKYLFGKNGIAPINSIIGIAIKYTSSTSRHRGVKHISDLRYDDNIKEIETEFNFNKGIINDDVQYRIILYLKDITGIINDDESHLNKVKGTILGVLDEVMFNFRGSGSFFNTVKINNPKEVLWYLRADFEPDSDVKDSIEMVINEGHKDYGLFDPNNKLKYNIDFIREVTISIVVMIINKGYQFINEIDNNEYDVGKVGHLIKYYLSLFNINNNNIEEVHKLVSKGIRI